MAILTRSIAVQGPAGAVAATGPQASVALSSVQFKGLGTFGQPLAAAVEISSTLLGSALQGCSIQGSAAAGLAVVNASNVAITGNVVAGSVGSSVLVQNSTAYR